VDRSIRVPTGAIVKTGYLDVFKVGLACRERMAVGDVSGAYQKLLQLGPDEQFPCPNGYWDDQTFVTQDGRHQWFASVMLGTTRMLVPQLPDRLASPKFTSGCTACTHLVARPPALADVTVTSPSNGATVQSPFTLVANATPCQTLAVGAMAYSLDSQPDTIVKATSLYVSVKAALGAHVRRDEEEQGDRRDARRPRGPHHSGHDARLGDAGEGGTAWRGCDESPHCYKRLESVLSAQGDSIRVLHTLTPVGVAMAGEDTYDPFKD
jgi:hypothetical protein